MKNHLAGILLFCTSAHGAQVFDAVVGYKGRTESAAAGVQKLILAGKEAFWNIPKSGLGDKDLPRVIDAAAKKRLAAHAKAWKAQGLKWICFDIEHLQPQKDPKTFNRFMIRCAAIVRKSAPGLKLGFYGCPPIRDYYRSLKGAENADFKAWQAENDALRPAALAMDAIFPSLYTFYDGRDDEWMRYGQSNIDEAKRYGKPVYAFIWPRFHDSNLLLAWSRLGIDLWRRELSWVASQADGVVVWDYGQQKPWDESAEWWQAVKELAIQQPEPGE